MTTTVDADYLVVGAGASGMAFTDTLIDHCDARVVLVDRRHSVGGHWLTLQPVRAGFPCFGAGLTGYVEATRDDDEVKNALCRPSPYGNTLAEWARMNVLGSRNAAAFAAEPDIREWSHQVALNPARIPPGHPASAELDDALERLQAHAAPGVARLTELVG